MSEQNNENAGAPLLTASASPSGLKVETQGSATGAAAPSSPQLLVVTTGGGASPKQNTAAASPNNEGNAAATLSNEYRFVHQRIPSRKGKLRYVLPGLLFSLQIVFIILFGVFANYGSADLSNSTNAILFNILMVLGFGFIASFLKRFGYGSVGFNLVLVAFVVQWALLLRGWMGGVDGYFKVSLNSLVYADYTAVAVLISFGVVLGKTTLTQLAVLALVETVIQVLNEHLNVHVIQAYDVGRSMYVHLFGALFGLAVSKFLNCSGVKSNKQASVYHSDVFALIGTVAVFALYPVFNAALSSSFDGQTRAIINTVAAISASVVITVGLSSLLGKGKVSVLHVQHAAIVGGIAIGSVADMKIQIYIALLAGAIGGFLATLSYQYVTPLLGKCLKLHDTCGIFGRHAVPALIGGILSAVYAAAANYEDYHNLYNMYPARRPITTTPATTTAAPEIAINGTVLALDDVERTASEQAGFQVIALAVTVGIALVTGALTGLLLRLPLFEQLSEDVEMFDDEAQWVTPEDYALKLTFATNVQEEEKKDDSKV